MKGEAGPIQRDCARLNAISMQMKTRMPPTM